MIDQEEVFLSEAPKSESALLTPIKTKISRISNKPRTKNIKLRN